MVATMTAANLAAIEVLGTVMAAAVFLVAAGEVALRARPWPRWLDVLAILLALAAGAALVQTVREAPPVAYDRFAMSIAFGLWGLVVGCCLGLRYAAVRRWRPGPGQGWRTFAASLLVVAFAAAGCSGGCGVGMLALP